MEQEPKEEPKARIQYSDGTGWYTLANQSDIEVDNDIYSLLQALNDEVL